MARAGAKRTDPQARRPGESIWGWRSRVVGQKQAARDRAEPLITPETARQAEYTDDTVMHVETGTRVQTKRRRQKSALLALADRGRITQDQLIAAQQIARVAESIRRHVSLRCASLEARVDCSGSSTNLHTETLRQVRMERAYAEWRLRIPLPRAMIVEMIVQDAGLKAIARQHGRTMTTAMRKLLEALDDWNAIMSRVCKDVDERDLSRAITRIAA